MEVKTTHISSKIGWFDLNLKELWQYKDLIWLFFKRNYSTMYKQTILGPLWLILNPLLSVALYSIVFGYLAGLSTYGMPKLVFYLSSNALWTFFSTCLKSTSNTFVENASIMGKVYFPRLVMPISSVLTGFLSFVVQILMLVSIIAIYMIKGYTFSFDYSVLLIPVLSLQVGLLGLGFGIIISALTTRYRDLVILVEFGLQLWMYATPVVYTSELIPEKYRTIYMINPMAPIIECWRHASIGVGDLSGYYWGISWIITLIILIFGVVLFSYVEKTFMDTV